MSETAPGPTGSPFGARGWRLALLIGVALLTSLSLGLREPDPTGADPGAHAFSLSAIGHHALVQWLEEVGLSPAIERSRANRQTREGVAMLMLAPDICASATRCHRMSSNIQTAVSRGASVLVALPRWVSPRPREDKPHFAASLTPLRERAVAGILARVVAASRGELEPAIIEGALTEEADRLAEHLRLVKTTQAALSFVAEPGSAWAVTADSLRLLDPDTPGLRPVIVDTHTGGVLVAQAGSTAVHILSDATLLGNALFARPDHPDLLHRLLRETLGARQVIIDETVHAHYLPPSLWRTLVDMPLLPLTLSGLLVFALFLWRESSRASLVPEGDPRPEVRGAVALAEASARLLEEARAEGHSLERYWESCLRDLAHALSVPGDLASPARLEQLTERARGLGLDWDLHALDTAVRGRTGSPLVLARAIHTLREELTRGYTHGDQGHHGHDRHRLRPRPR